MHHCHHVGNKTVAIREIALMRVRSDDSYILIGSYGGRPKHPQLLYNLRSNAELKICDQTEVFETRVREVEDDPDCLRFWNIRGLALQTYTDYQQKAPRKIRVFSPEPF